MHQIINPHDHILWQMFFFFSDIKVCEQVRVIYFSSSSRGMKRTFFGFLLTFLSAKSLESWTLIIKGMGHCPLYYKIIALAGKLSLSFTFLHYGSILLPVSHLHCFPCPVPALHLSFPLLFLLYPLTPSLLICVSANDTFIYGHLQRDASQSSS